MFLNFIKNFLLKRKLKNSLITPKFTVANNKIQTVGLIIDERVFDQKLELLKEFIKHDISLSNIKLLIYNEKSDDKNTSNEPVFSMKSFNWNGEVIGKELNNFIKQDFDLLINYFDNPNLPILYASYMTNASFRVGFESNDKKYNDIIIKSPLNEYELFTAELFRYLKILNKI